jgi:AcrR family transcriptional regulator
MARLDTHQYWILSSMFFAMSDVKGKGEPSAAPGSRLAPEPGARVRRPTRDEVRRRLLDAALAVFAEHGFDTANLDQIADAAGLTKGAIYSNFTGKDDLFYAMMAEQILVRVESIRSALNVGTADPLDPQELRDIGDLLTEAFTEQREWRMVFLDFWRRAVRDDDVRERFIAHRRTMRDAIAASVEEILGGSPPAGDFTVDDVVTVVLALSNGLAIEQYVDPSSVSSDLFGRVLMHLSGHAVPPT